MSSSPKHKLRSLSSALIPGSLSPHSTNAANSRTSSSLGSSGGFIIPSKQKKQLEQQKQKKWTPSFTEQSVTGGGGSGNSSNKRTPSVTGHAAGRFSATNSSSQLTKASPKAVSPSSPHSAASPEEVEIVIPDGKIVYTSRLQKNFMKLVNLNKYSKVYVLNCFFLLFSTLFAVATNVVFNTLEDVPSYSSFISSGNIMIAGLIILFFALDAVFRENEFQMILFIVVCCSITVIMIGNSIFKTVELIQLFVDTQDWIRILQFILNSLFSILVIISLAIFMALAYPVYKSFGWKLFKVVGTNKLLLRAFKIYNLWITLLKADIVLTIDLSLLNLFFAPSLSWGWFCAVFFTLLFHLIGYLISVPLFIFAARREIRILFILLLCYQFLFPVWLSGKTIQTIIFLFTGGEAYQNPWRNLPVGMANWSIDIKFSYAYMGGLSIVGLIFRGMVVITSFLVLFHMKKGLKEVFDRRKLYVRAKKKKRAELIVDKRKEKVRSRKKKKRDRIKQEMANKMASQLTGTEYMSVYSSGATTPSGDGMDSSIGTDFSSVIGGGGGGSLQQTPPSTPMSASATPSTTGGSMVAAGIPMAALQKDIDLSETDDDLSESDRFSSSSSESEEDYEDEIRAMELEQQKQKRPTRNII